MKRATATAILLCFLMASNTRALDFITARGIGLGQTAVLSEPSASTLLTIPGGGLFDRQGKIEMGAWRRFEIKDLDQGYLAAAYRVGSFTCALGVTQLGFGDYYTERTARGSAAYHIASFAFGVNVSMMQIDFGGHYDNLSAGGVGLGFSYRTPKFIGAVVAENVNWPRLGKLSEKIKPSYTLYTELIGPGSYSITGKVTVQDSEKPDFGVGQKIDLSSIAAVFWGISSEPIIYGGGLELIYKRSLITYATSYHPTLGFSHTLTLGFTFGKTGSAVNDKSQERRH